MMATVSGDGSHRVEGFVNGDLSSAFDDRASLRHLRSFVQRGGLQDAVARRAFADRALCDRAVFLDFADLAGKWIAAVDHRRAEPGPRASRAFPDRNKPADTSRLSPHRRRVRPLTRGGCCTAAAIGAPSLRERKA